MAEGRMANDELGAWGEAQFKSACTVAGLVASKADPDKMGWDYHVELPPQNKAECPLDQQINALSCYVQVKTQWLSSDGRIGLSLSAAQRLAMHSAPAFVMAILVEENLAGGDPQIAECYLIHLLDRNFEYLLKRLRETQSEPDHKELNRITISFDPRKTGERIELQGNTLKGMLQRLCGPAPHAYALKKEKQRKNLGYSGRRYKIFTTFNSTKPDDFNDIMLGRKPGKLQKFAVDDIRFGIPVRIHQAAGEGLRITVTQNPIAQCLVRVRSPTSDGAVVFEGDVITTAHMWEQPDHQIFLYRTQFFDLEFRGDGSTSFYSKMATEDTKLSLSDWQRYLRLCQVLTNSKVIFEIESRNPLAFHAEISAEVTGGEASWATPLLETVKQAIAILDYAGFDLGLIQIGIIEQGAVGIAQAYRRILEPTEPPVRRLTVLTNNGTSIPPDQLSSLNAPKEILCPEWVRLGEVLVVWALRMQISIESQKEGQYRLSEKEASLIRMNVLPANADAFNGFVSSVQKETGLNGSVVWNFTDHDLEEPAPPELPAEGPPE